MTRNGRYFAKFLGSKLPYCMTTKRRYFANFLVFYGTILYDKEKAIFRQHFCVLQYCMTRKRVIPVFRQPFCVLQYRIAREMRYFSNFQPNPGENPMCGEIFNASNSFAKKRLNFSLLPNFPLLNFRLFVTSLTKMLPLISNFLGQ